MNKRIKLSIGIFLITCLSMAAGNLLNMRLGTTEVGLSPTQPYVEVKGLGNSLEINYEFDFAEIVPGVNEFGNFITLNIEGFSNIGDPGTPAIPFKSDIFSLGHGENPIVEIINTEFVEIDLPLAACQHLPLAMETYVKAPDVKMTPYQGYLPLKVVEDQPIFSIKGKNYMKVGISPVQYNFETKKARVYSKITYRLSWSSSAQADDDDADTETLYDSLVLNKPIADRAMKTALDQSNDNIQDDGLLIVTSKALETVANNYASAKKLLGFKTYVSLFDNPRPKDTTTIANHISAMVNQHPEISALLILGDNSHIPAFKSKLDDHGTIYDYVTDLYYVADRGNHSPLIAQGRIPFSIADSISPVLNNINDYEMNPDLPESFYNSGVHWAYWESTNNTSHEPGKTVNVEQSNYSMAATSYDILSRIKNDYGREVKEAFYYRKNNDSTVYGLPKYWRAKYPDNSNGAIVQIPANMQTESYWSPGVTGYLNEGHNYVYYNGHGQVAAIGAGWVTPKHAKSFDYGRRRPVMFLMACLLGAYDQIKDLSHLTADSIAKYRNKWGDTNMTRELLCNNSHNAGAVGVLSATTVAWSTTNNMLAKNIFDELWPTQGTTIIKNQKIGDVITKAQIRVLQSKSANMKDDNNIYVQNMRYYHYFGDPTMKFFVQKPVEVTSDIIHIELDPTNTKYLVTPSSANGAEYIFYNNKNVDNQPLKFNKPTTVQIPKNELEDYKICITGNNLIPKVLNPKDFVESNDAVSRFNATYNANTNSIITSYIISGNHSTVQIGVYLAEWGYIMSSPVTAYSAAKNGLTIRLPYLPSTQYKTFIVVLYLDGEYAKSIQIR